jgi:SAM-dependent methyltransferase
VDVRLGEWLKRLSLWLGAASVRHAGVVLPARHLRLCGAEFRDDAHFLASAQREAERLRTRFALGPGSRLLDVGCGYGRLAIGVLSTIGDGVSYRGIDVSAAAIAWCRRHIQREHPSFVFTRVDVRNARYNPGGEALDGAFRLPLDDASFDVAYLYSVFSHMEAEDVRLYVRELARIIRPGGGVFLTMFVADGVDDVTINPADSEAEWRGPLHCVRYRRGYVERLFHDSGFTIAAFSQGTETDGQSGYELRR